MHMSLVIDRMMRENNSTAIECIVTLIGGAVSLQGSLMHDQETSGVRMMCPVPNAPPSLSQPGAVQMIEHFLHYEAILLISVPRTVTLETPRIHAA